MAGTFRYTLGADYDDAFGLDIYRYDGAPMSSVVDGALGISVLVGSPFTWTQDSGISTFTFRDSAINFLPESNISFYLDYSGLTNAAQFQGADLGDRLIGGLAGDSLNGNNGDDLLEGGAGADALNGGDGSDTASYAGSSAGVTVDINAGTFSGGDAEGDTLTGIENLTGSDHADTLTGDGNGNTLDGGGGDDALDGGEGADALNGNGDDDVLNGGAGADALDGGSGSDTASYAGAAGAVVAWLINPAANFGESLGDTFTSIENLTGSDFADTLVGNDFANLLMGGAGNDQLFGTVGDDTLIGGAGADTLNGGFDVNTASYVGSSAGVTVNLDAGTASGGDAAGDTFFQIANLTGSDHADTLTGDSGVNVLDGGAGADGMAGGDGNDRYVVDDAGDTVTEGDGEGAGSDSVVAAISYTLGDNLENLVLSGTAGEGTGNDVRNLIVGNAAANILSGLEGNDRLDGGAGADDLDGGDGNDAYLVDDLDDTITESDGAGSGRDKAFVNVEGYALAAGQHVEFMVLREGIVEATGNDLANTIVGNAANNDIFGLAGDDRLEGRDGNDTLIGGAGADVLIGAAGSDRFRFDTLADGVDTIARFEAGTDHISLLEAIFGAEAPDSGVLDEALFKANARGVATEADDRVIFSTGTGRLHFDADGSGDGAAVQIARITGAAGLSHLDIDII